MDFNLRQEANNLTQGVNPNIPAIVYKSVGYAKDAAFRPVGQYADPISATIQLQALTKKEVEHLDSLNISNAEWGCYANLQLTPVDRAEQSGGDLVKFTDPSTGKPVTCYVVAGLEAWGGIWAKIALAKQMDGRQGID